VQERMWPSTQENLGELTTFTDGHRVASLDAIVKFPALD
jgi:hypothetical protein